MFKKAKITHCLVVPAQSTLGSSAQCRAGDILISSSSEEWPILTLLDKIQNMIANVFTVSEGGEYSIDESKLPPGLLLPDHSSTRYPSPEPVLLLDHSSTRYPSPEPSGTTTATTTMPRIETKQITTEQVMPDLETNSQSTVESANRPTAAVEMPIVTGTIKDSDNTNRSRQIPASPVSIEDIWPFIQDIASEVAEHGVELGLCDDGAMKKLSTTTLADIQFARLDSLTSPAPPSIQHAPGNIRMPIASAAHGGKDYHPPPRPTVLTPSTYGTTEGSRTQIAEPDGAAQMNREIIREEVNRALAGAVAKLAGLLSCDVGRVT